MSKVYGLATNKLATFFQIPLRITLLTASCMQCVCVCVRVDLFFCCMQLCTGNTDAQLTDAYFHFPASVAFTVIQIKKESAHGKKLAGLK